MAVLQKFYLTNIFNEDNQPSLEKIHKILLPYFEDITQNFYTELMNDSSARAFLNNDLVEKRLKHELYNWLNSTLLPDQNNLSLSELVGLQQRIGVVHARINVPMSTVDSAMLLIKNRCFDILFEHIDEKPELFHCIKLLNEILESSLSIINDSYMKGVVKNERNSQAFRSTMSSHDLVIEIERVRSDLFTWLSETTLAVMTGEAISADSLKSSTFGLWASHKLENSCPDDDRIVSIKKTIKETERTLSNKSLDSRSICIKINASISNIGWLLSELSNNLARRAAQEDGLTRLLDRKFLAPILQKETQSALNTKSSYSVIMLDIDHFKQINDLHGHHAGDQVLARIGNILRNKVRVSDYCFRYGGEEFLVLLPECDPSKAYEVAEMLRTAVSEEVIAIGKGRIIRITVSAGVSRFIGHPDYMETLKCADSALYEAKHLGRNRTIVSHH